MTEIQKYNAAQYRLCQADRKKILDKYTLMDVDVIGGIFNSYPEPTNELVQNDMSMNAIVEELNYSYLNWDAIDNSPDITDGYDEDYDAMRCK